MLASSRRRLLLSVSCVFVALASTALAAGSGSTDSSGCAPPAFTGSVRAHSGACAPKTPLSRREIAAPAVRAGSPDPLAAEERSDVADQGDSQAPRVRRVLRDSRAPSASLVRPERPAVSAQRVRPERPAVSAHRVRQERPAVSGQQVRRERRGRRVQRERPARPDRPRPQRSLSSSPSCHRTTQHRSRRAPRSRSPKTVRRGGCPDRRGISVAILAG